MSASDSVPAVRIEALLADSAWVQGLARNLLDPPGRADDVVQETWLAALERGPREDTNLRGWLATVARNAVKKTLRGEDRRRGREAQAARADTAPSTFEVVERFSSHHAVATAVLALEEPFRETILLRYYEELPRAEIAGRMGVAPSTVDGRIRRGLEQLRRALDRSFGGDGRSWAVALVPLALSRAATASPVAAPLALAGKAALACAVVLALGASLWTVLAPTPEPERARLARREVGADGTEPGLAGRVRPPAAGTARRAPVDVASAPGPASGALFVRAVGPDGAPVADASVRVWPEETGVPIFARTGGDGAVLVPELAAGHHRIELDGRSRRVAIRADETAEVELRARSGPAVLGRVVDERGTPVADAAVWISNEEAETYAGGRTVASLVGGAPAARTDGDGRFTLPSLGSARLLGAAAPGHAPSTGHRLAPSDGPALELTLRLEAAGGSVAGTVRDPDGRPLSGAMVFLDAAGDDGELADGTRIARPAPLFTALTDEAGEAGRFRFASVRPGARRMLARAPGLAPWRGTVEVRAHAESSVDVVLDAGMRAAGTVTDEAGEPLAGVLVYGARWRWSAPPDLRHGTTTRTREDGGYELVGLSPGACWLTVDGGSRGRSETLLVGNRDEPIRHDVVLSRGLELAGRVVDERGTGMPGCHVHAAPSGEWTWTAVHTDDEGGFALPNRPDRTHRVVVLEDGVTVLDTEVEPGSEDVVLVVPEAKRPTAVVTGTLVDHAGRPAQALALRLDGRDGANFDRHESAVVDQGAGRFRTGRMPPGAWRVTVRAEDRPAARVEGEVELFAGAVVDLGVVTLPAAGSVVLDVTRADGRALRDLFVRITDEAGEPVRDLHLHDAEPALPLSLTLATGTYSVVAWGERAVPRRAELSVAADETARIGLALESGVPQRLRFHLPEEAVAGERLHVVIRTATGPIFFECDYRLVGTPSFEETLDFPPGSYTYEAATSPGHRGSGSFTVADVSHQPAPIECDLH